MQADTGLHTAAPPIRPHVSSTAANRQVERLMTLSTSAVAVCCSERLRSSLSSRVFSMAMTACAAKFVTSSICFSVNGALPGGRCVLTPRLVPSQHRHPKITFGTAEHLLVVRAAVLGVGAARRRRSELTTPSLLPGAQRCYPESGRIGCSRCALFGERGGTLIALRQPIQLAISHRKYCRIRPRKAGVAFSSMARRPAAVAGRAADDLEHFRGRRLLLSDSRSSLSSRVFSMAMTACAAKF